MFSGFAPTLMEGGKIGRDAFILIGFALLGLSYGQAAGAVTANFGRRYRYTGAALTSDSPGWSAPRSRRWSRSASAPASASPG